MYFLIAIVLIILYLISLFDIWVHLGIVIEDSSLEFMRIVTIIVFLIWCLLVPFFWFSGTYKTAITYKVGTVIDYTQSERENWVATNVYTSAILHNGSSYACVSYNSTIADDMLIVDNTIKVPYMVYYYKEYNYPFLVGKTLSVISSTVITNKDSIRNSVK